MQYVDKDFIRRCNLNQKEVILLHLVKNGYITNKQCNEGYGYRHLPGIIRDLKKYYGAKIMTIGQRGLNQFKQKTNYVEYHIQNREAFQCL